VDDGKVTAMLGVLDRTAAHHASQQVVEAYRDEALAALASLERPGPASDELLALINRLAVRAY
jgi:geranylgeranyl pyrophosphate synthase